MKMLLLRLPRLILDPMQIWYVDLHTPIERAIATAEGIDYIESSSQAGVSTIKAHLKLNFNGKSALSEISTKVDQVVIYQMDLKFQYFLFRPLVLCSSVFKFSV